MKDISSRERVYLVTNFEEPDKVPICFAGCGSTTILECPPKGCVCSDLYQYVGIKDTKPEIGPLGNVVASPDDRLIERLHSDMHAVYASILDDVIMEDENTKIWPFNFGMRIKKVGIYDEIDFKNAPMANMTTRKDIESYPYWPDVNANIMNSVVEKAKYLHENTNYFLVGESPLSYYPLNGYGYLSGMDKWLIDMKIRPQYNQM